MVNYEKFKELLGGAEEADVFNYYEKGQTHVIIYDGEKRVCDAWVDCDDGKDAFIFY